MGEGVWALSEAGANLAKVSDLLTVAPSGFLTAAAFATDSIPAAAISAAAVTKIQTGLATPTNITAGAITECATTTALTNLPAVPTDWLTAAGVKADAVTKIQSGLSTFAGGAVASVTGAVGSIASGGITAASFAANSITDAAIAVPAFVAGPASRVLAMIVWTYNKLFGKVVYDKVGNTVTNYLADGSNVGTTQTATTNATTDAQGIAS